MGGRYKDFAKIIDFPAFLQYGKAAELHREKGAVEVLVSNGFYYRGSKRDSAIGVFTLYSRMCVSAILSPPAKLVIL